MRIRPMRREDMPMEADFVRHLSGETRYKRFMLTLRELSPEKLRYLTDVDQVRHVALVATIDGREHEVEIGVARYIVDPASTGCEFAIAVDDAWQGSGVAGILMHALIEVARSRGLAAMEGFVLRTNSRILRFARQLGFELRPDPDDRAALRARTFTLTIRTVIFPRWMAFFGYGLALLLLLNIGLIPWISLVFPLWVLLISGYILFKNLSRSPEATSSQQEMNV